MDSVMDPEEMRALAKELAKGLKTEQDSTEFTTQLTKMAVEAALGGEMEHHRDMASTRLEGVIRAIAATAIPSTSRGPRGEVDLEVPRDRNGTFEPTLVKKHQTCLTQMDDQIWQYTPKA